MSDESSVPDFTPGVVLGMVLSVFPRRPLERAAQILTHRLNTRHPGLRERLGEADGKSFALVLSDMPFNAMLAIDGGRLGLTLAAKTPPPAADVTLHGASETFIGLLEGRVDGDALFFSRELRVEGDTEALLVLRNALDNEQISLRDTFLAVFGPLSGLAARVAVPVETVGARFVRDMRRLHRSALSPLVRQQRQFAESLRGMEQRLARMESTLARKQARHG